MIPSVATSQNHPKKTKKHNSGHIDWPMVVTWYHTRATLVRTVGWQVRTVGFQFQLVKTEPDLGLIFGTQFRVGIRFIPQFAVPLVKLVEVFCCNNLVKMGRPLTAPLLPLKNIISLVNIALILHQSKSSSFYSMGNHDFWKGGDWEKKISMDSWIS
jgi:hypothetical protein